MEQRRWNVGIAIGAGIGALLGVVLFYLAFGPEALHVGIRPVAGGAMIGATLGAVLGWALSRPRPTVAEWIGVATPRTRIVMWVATVMAIYFAVSAGIGGEFVEALGWLALAGAWTLQASGAAERARFFLYLSGGVLLLGLLLVSTGFILGEL